MLVPTWPRDKITLSLLYPKVLGSSQDRILLFFSLHETEILLVELIFRISFVCSSCVGLVATSRIFILL